ncbi:MAG: hypothetical protein JO307_31475 [Bryobacterales bacterium]|nr:hypothetical protein [Bryobacterales bacterium]MBV9397442.1 hypothetical protein [Bryobacterales bacterium]
MLLSFAQWVQATGLFSAVRMSWYVYPVILSLHLVAISIFGGMVLMTNLRLLGLALKDRLVSDVVDQLRIPKRIFFVLVALFGILLAGSKAEEYYYNYFFWIKMSLLALLAVHALVFRAGVYDKAAELNQVKKMPGRVKLAAALSLLLWTCVACAGRGIGYVEPPLEKLHAEIRTIFLR